MDLSLNNFKLFFTKLSKLEILKIVLEVFNTVGYQFTDHHQLNLNFVSKEEMKVLNKDIVIKTNQPMFCLSNYQKIFQLAIKRL